MLVRVAFRLLRRDEPAAADAVLLASDDPAALLSACARLTDPLIFPVAGEFLVVADAIPAPIAHATRLRRLSENCYLPIDADLVPALSRAEAVDLTARRGLAFLHGRDPLAFDPARPLKRAAFLAVARPRRDDWEPFPAGNPPAEMLTGVTRVIDIPPDDLLAVSGPPVGAADARPPEVGPGRRALGRIAAGLGKGLKGLGKALGSDKLAKLGGKLLGRAAALAPRLTEELLGRQEAALQHLLNKFREGNTEDALRRAIPVGHESGRGNQIYDSDRLPTQNLSWSFFGLFGGGRASIWAGGNPETWRNLIAEYCRAAQVAADRGDFRRAALIYAKLLDDYRAAAEVLARGGLHREAGILFRNKVRQLDRAALEFDKAGEHDEALRLYRESYLYLDAGDLLRRLGDEELAVVEYHRAAERVIELRKDYVEAGDILLKKTGRADLAGAYFALGWGERKTSLANAKNALPCAERLIEIYAFAEPRDPFWELLTETEDWLREPGWAHDAGRFFNQVVGLAELPHLADDRSEIRDRCRVGLAGKLREHAKSEATAGTAVSDLFSQSQRWSPAVVSDADFALRVALKLRPIQESPTERKPIVLRLRADTVTAVAQAPDSGDLFVGYQNGALDHYNPRSGEVRVVHSHRTEPVHGLATDAAGECVVALRTETADPAAQADQYVLEFHNRGFKEFRLYSRERIVAPSGSLYGVLPLVDQAQRQVAVGLSTVNGVTWYGAPGLIVRAEPGPTSPLPPTTHLKLRVLGHGDESTFTFHGGSVSWDGNRAYIGRMPDLAPGSTLFTPPVAWLVTSPGQVELAVVHDNAALYWTEVTRRLNLPLATRTLTFVAPGGFRATTIWRPGQVVGVTATNRVLWMKTRGGRFEE